MRGWRTSMELRGGKEQEMSSITSYKTYNMLEAKGVINQIRAAEMGEGRPKRKISPVARYLLDELIRKYFKYDAPRGITLERITIKDNRLHET